MKLPGHRVSVMSLITGSLIYANFATAQVQEDAARMRTQIREQVERLTLSSDVRTRRMISEINDKYGFSVACARSYVLWSELSADECMTGISSILRAMDGVDFRIIPSRALDVSVTIGQPGLWQQMTMDSKNIQIPFNASPDKMKDFINKELRLIYSVSLADLEKLNARIIKDIEQNYHVQVLPLLRQDFVKQYDGLQRLRMALRMVYGGQQPSPEEAKSVAFDAIVLGALNEDLYENQAQLRVGVDSSQRAGEMFQHLIKQTSLRSRAQELAKRQTGVLDIVQNTPYDWQRVERFRETKNRINDLIQWANQTLGEGKLSCILDRQEQSSLKLENCREGLENFQVLVSLRRVPLSFLQNHRIKIGDLFYFNVLERSNGNTLIIDYQAKPEAIQKALMDE